MIKFNYPSTIDVSKVEPLLDEIIKDPMSGWFDLPKHFNQDEIDHIKAAAKKINSDSKYLVCIGIGGSYLGHRAILEALGNHGADTKILYIGNSLDPYAMQKTIEKLSNHSFSINVISKSGTTLEPAIAFRIFKQILIEKYGEKEAYKRIYATTDSKKGALYEEAVKNGYERFVIPDNVGGRYSVFTAVGLLPIAVSRLDVDAFISGATEEYQDLMNVKLENNPAAQYACCRYQHYLDGCAVELLASFAPSMLYFHEWWEQLFGESEGKNHKGIFPTSAVYTTDLHSLGQFVQDGSRNISETIIRFAESRVNDVLIPKTKDNYDELKYVEGKSLAFVNSQAVIGTINAHRAGGIPVHEILAPALSERTLGALMYFFEYACAISAKLLEVNPFDQPGVEAYKNEIFRLLGRPGF